MIRAVLHRSLNYIAERCLRRAFLRNARRTPTHGEYFAGDRFFISRRGAKQEGAMPLAGFAYALWRFLQAIAYHNFTTISNISCSMNLYGN
ncbi:hypothetical protein [Nostoc sp.]|uniref:hypothetical protein n=1 Tax=Nostoc sp. TaxID=1180 RepID=UPI002FF475B2